MNLTPRQLETLRLLADGLGRREAAELMGVETSTIDKHVGFVIKRLEAQSLIHAVAIAFRKGILS